MPQLVLNRRLNYRNILLTDRPGGEVGYLLRDGERRFVPWLGFIERAEARALEDAKPVRLTDITRVGVAGWPAPQWREVAPGECVHGCLTSRGPSRSTTRWSRWWMPLRPISRAETAVANEAGPELERSRHRGLPDNLPYDAPAQSSACRLRAFSAS